MKTCRITFSKCVQDSQDLGSDDEHMVSRVFFDLQIDEQMHRDLYCDIKQVVGSSYETGDIEVSRPVGYKGPFNYTAYRDAVEGYYRHLVGSSGIGIRTSGGAGSIRMRNNTFIVAGQAQFDVDESAAGAW